MRIGQRAVVRVLAFSMRRWSGPGDHAEIRRIFDERYKDETPEFRRDTWAAAAERYQGKVSR